MQVTRAAALFDRLADELVEQLRTRLERRELDAAARQEQLRQLRERLDGSSPAAGSSAGPVSALRLRRA